MADEKFRDEDLPMDQHLLPSIKDTTPFNYRKFFIIIGPSVIIIFIVTLALVLGLRAQYPVTRPSLVVIAFDGFRFDYLNKIATPNITQFIRDGFKLQHMRASFPTLTFPNFYTISTGLYPESHGIVNNAFYDPELNRTFKLGNSDTVDTVWWKGEPIWVTAVKQGLKVATLNWVGSEAVIGGYRPTYWNVYNSSINYESRIDSILSWLDLDDDLRPHLIMVYFESPDSQGHQYGPNSNAVQNAILSCDSLIGRLDNGLRQRNLISKANVIILADHGMTSVSNATAQYLEDYIDLNIVNTVTRSPVLGFYPMNNDTLLEDTYQKLKNMSNCSVYKKSQILPKYHYNNSIRIPDLIAVMELGWTATTRTAGVTLKGNHGYDNDESDMFPFFAARGPKFINATDEMLPFDNIQVYSIMSAILGITPAPNNGSVNAINYVLVNT